MTDTQTCRHETCRYKAHGDGWCKRHSPALAAHRSETVRACLSTEEEAPRFWRKVSIGSDDECWPFVGSVDARGYGSFCSVGRHSKLAHRVAWRLTHGEESSACVLHSCDNPPCCNPAHLWEGTRADNNRDMEAKGRDNRPKGSAHCRAKVSEDDVAFIKRQDRTRARQRELAAQFGMTRSGIDAIQRHGWKHVE